MHDEEEKTDHFSEDERVHITRTYTLARAFEQNIMIALGELDSSTPPSHRIDDKPKRKPRKVKKEFHRQCAYTKCNAHFITTNARLRYHTKECRDHANDAKYRGNKKRNPVKYAAMKRHKNMAWADHVYDENKPPPIFPGRPTQVKKQDLREFRNRLERIEEEARWSRRSNANATTVQDVGDDT